jgi:N-methylhydantoinase B
LCEKYDSDVVLECFEMAIHNSERLMREEITRIRPGRWTWTDHLDDDGQSDQPVKISAAVMVQGSDIAVDFTGSAPQVSGGINMTSSFRDSYVHLAVRCYVDSSIPHNEGCLLPVHISAPAGTIVNPVRPAAVAGRSVLISRVVDTVMACLAQAVPERAVAGYGGCNAQPVVSGTSPRTGRYFIFLDSNWGGLGGRSGRDGIDCLSFPQNVANHPIEVLEASYPVRIERYEIRTDSEGPGKFRGGLGSVKDYRLLADARLQVPGDRTKLPPFGLMGGGPGALTAYVRIRDGEEEALLTKREYRLAAGDILSVRTSGGGGLYPAVQRDPDWVARDVALGYITADRVKSAYGVVVDRDGDIDMAATTALRGHMERA